MMFGKRRNREAALVKALKLQSADLIIVVDNDLTHAHGPYSSLKQAAALCQMESAKSGKPHTLIPFEFTTGMVIKPEEIEEAMQKAKQQEYDSDSFKPGGYL